MTGRAEVERLRRHLDATFQRIKGLPASVDLEIQSDFARYLCVLVSGYLEKSVSELVLEHARRKGSPTLQRFVEGSTRRFANANMERVLTLLGSFDPDWRRDLESVLAVEHKDAVNSVVGLRNNIAHGGMAGVTYQRIAEYYVQVQHVVERIAAICGVA
jgi:hypothetical protein